MHNTLLFDIIIILSLAVVVSWVFSRFRLPPVIGYLITGLIIGPSVLSLVGNQHEVELLAEIGIIFLLFTIGMELSLKQFWSLRKSVFLGGGIQVLLMWLFVFGISLLFNFTFNEAVFLGFLFSLSSTAIVLKILKSRDETDSPHGRTVIAILIFQDIIVVPMMLLVPILAGGGGDPMGELLSFIIKATALIVFTILAARYLVPRLLFAITKTGSDELFILTITVFCLGVAVVTNSLGLSFALGAFLAGLCISQTEYSHQATSIVLPLREIFTSFFFVSVGMLMDLNFFLEHPLMIIGISAAVILVKVIAGMIAGAAIGKSLRTMMLVGIVLGQMSEFAFILVEVGDRYEIITESMKQYFLSVSVLTMGVSPLIITGANKFTDLVIKRFFHIDYRKVTVGEDFEQKLTDHLVIIGFGINGRYLAKSARMAGIPYCVIEMNADTVRKERHHHNILYGDASHEHVLVKAAIKEARVAVVAVRDFEASRRIISAIKRCNEHTYVVVRTSYMTQLEALQDIGADVVIPEEFEAAIEIFTRVLTKYLLPRDEIEQFTDEIRAENYRMMRATKFSPVTLKDIHVEAPHIELCSMRVKSHHSIKDKTISEYDLRNKHGISIIAINRNNQMITNPTSSIEIKENDLLYLFGEHEEFMKWDDYTHPTKE